MFDTISTTLGDNLVALYQYKETKKTVIPVIIVRSLDFAMLEKKKNIFENKQFILFTQNDILEGADVFPLKFLHIRTHSVCIHGIDILKSLVLEKKNMRMDLERELRQKCIQLRESYFSAKNKKKFADSVLDVLAIIHEGCAFLNIPQKEFDSFTVINLHTYLTSLISEVNEIE